MNKHCFTYVSIMILLLFMLVSSVCSIFYSNGKSEIDFNDLRASLVDR